MKSIIIKTKYVEYEVSEKGENIRFSNNKASVKIKNSHCAYLINNDKAIVEIKKIMYSENELTMLFEDGTEAGLEVCTHDEYFTYTLRYVSRNDFFSFVFFNLEIEQSDRQLIGCLMGMTLSTHMEEHPGDNRILRAAAYPHIGLLKTTRSDYPVKAAIIGSPEHELRKIQKKVVEEIPDNELPISKKGGPWANDVEEEAKGTYTVFSTTVTEKNIDDIIEALNRFCINQITLHHYGHYTQGDFKFDKEIYPNGMGDFKKLIDRFHKSGISVGLQTYSFFLNPVSSYVSPVPNRDLDILREFTLNEDIDINSKLIKVNEATEGLTPDEGYLVQNSPYLWVDDELIKFNEVGDGVFKVCERGTFGTVAQPHHSGAKVRQLKQYFFLPMARCGSSLFYQIAKNTAEFYNECGADYMYLDALDGAFILDGEEYAWYHGADFIREMYKYLDRDPIFDCCYNPAYTASWYARSRYGAIDESLLAHRQYIDAHVNYNIKTANKMRITPELGWVNFFPKYSAKGDVWQNEPISNEDVEYIYSKAFATGASLAYLRYFYELKDLPCSREYCSIINKYNEYKKTHTPTEKTKKYLELPECGGILEDNVLYKAKYPIAVAEHKNGQANIINDFDGQKAQFRIDTLYAAGSYDDEKSITLLNLDENIPVKNKKYRFSNPIDSQGNMALGVWCYGDNSGAIVCIALRNFKNNVQRCSQHFIKVDFTGWKYFAFHESQNGTLPADIWPRKELEYTSYMGLQKFYHQYRVAIDYSCIEGVDIDIKGSENIRLKPIKLVPKISPVWINPTIKNEKSYMKIFTELQPDDILIFNDKECIVKDWRGNVKSKPKYEGELIIPKGESVLTVTHDGDELYTRAKITLTLRGEKLQ